MEPAGRVLPYLFQVRFRQGFHARRIREEGLAEELVSDRCDTAFFLQDFFEEGGLEFRRHFPGEGFHQGVEGLPVDGKVPVFEESVCQFSDGGRRLFCG